MRTAGHHVRAHAVAEMRTSSGEFRLFLKVLKPERKEAELFAYDRLLPTAICSSPKVMARFPDWEWPTVWLSLEYLDGRWPSADMLADLLLTIRHATRVKIPQMRLIQLVMGYRSAEDLANELDVSIPSSVLPILSVLFPKTVGYIWWSDRF